MALIETSQNSNVYAFPMIECVFIARGSLNDQCVRLYQIFSHKNSLLSNTEVHVYFKIVVINKTKSREI